MGYDDDAHQIANALAWNGKSTALLERERERDRKNVTRNRKKRI